MLKCPKCGKAYKRGGVYYENHIISCTGKKVSEKFKISTTRSMKIEGSPNINFRLDAIENRLYQIEQELRILKFGKTVKSEIRSEKQFLEIINQKIHELSRRMLGIQKIVLKDLFNGINEEYNLSKDVFSKYLLKLYNRNKIQLEAGMSGEDFYIEDNYGNIFKLIRILD